MDEVDGRRHVSPELAVAALVAAASLPLTRLFTDGLGPSVVAAIALSVGASYGMRRLGMNQVAAWSTSMLLLMVFLSYRFFGETLWGPLPSFETLRAIGLAVREGARQTVEEVAPVASSTPLLLFVTSGIWLTCWLVHAAVTSLRNPLLAIASAVPLFAVPGAIVSGKRLWLEGAVFLVAAGLLLFLEQQDALRRLGPAGTEVDPAWPAGPAVRLGLVAALVTAIAAPALPGFGSEPVFQGATSGSRVYFNPIVAIKPSLDDDRDIELARVRMDRPAYLRLTSLDIFDGAVWQERGDRPIVPLSRHRFRTSPGRTEQLVQDVTIGALAGRWLPAAFQPRVIRGDEPGVETDDDTLVSPVGLQPGTRYVAESDVPAPTAASLDRPVTYDPFVFGSYMSLPRSVPGEVAEIARDWTRGTANPYEAALAIQNELRTFAYDQNVAAGHSFDDMVTFLTDVRAGYCEQFAGSMAVMLRTLGIPARVAIGFGIGDRIDEDTYRLTTNEAHAWVEVYFPQAGWVIFEPTPRAGVARLPEYAPPPREVPDGEPNEEPTRAPVDREPEPDPQESTGPEAPDFTTDPEASPWPFRIALILLATFTALGGPLIGVRRRRVRARAARSEREKVVVQYMDFLDWCAAAGIERGPGETPREHAARVAAVAAQAAAPLGSLVGQVEHALFAPPNGADGARAAADIGRVRAAVSPVLTRGARLKAALRWGSWTGTP